MAKTNNKTDKIAKRIKQTDKRINTVAFVFACAFFSAFVLIVFKDYTNITLVKYNTFLIFSIALTLYYAYEKGSLALTDNYFKNVTKKDFTPYILITFFTIFNVIATIFSPYSNHVNTSGKSLLLFGGGRYDGLIVLLLLILLFLIFSFEKIFSTAFVNIVATTTFLTLVIGFLQLFYQNPFNFYPTSFYETGKAFTTTLGNIDVVSTYLCIAFSLLAFSYIAIKTKTYVKAYWLTIYFFAVTFLLEINVDSGKVALLLTFIIALPLLARKKDYFVKLLDVLSVTFLSFGISSGLQFDYEIVPISDLYFTKTFIIMLILSATVIILRVVFEKILKEKHKKLLSIAFVLIEVLSLVTIVLFIKNNNFDNQTLSQLSMLLNGKADDSFGSHRLGLWKYTLQLCKERLFIGFGNGTFREGFYSFVKQISPVYATGSYDFAHNEYLQILYNCGLFGLISYLCLLAYLIIKSFKLYLKNEKIVVLLFAILSYLLQAFFTFSIVLVSPLFWILLGMLTFEIRNEEKQKV